MRNVSWIILFLTLISTGQQLLAQALPEQQLSDTAVTNMAQQLFPGAQFQGDDTIV